MNITGDTKLSEILKEYPWLRDELPRMNDKFKLLNTPMGKIMEKQVTVAVISKKSGIEQKKIIAKLEEIISKH